MDTTVPLQLSQKLARARSLLRRDDSARGVDALISGLQAYSSRQLLSKIRFEVEVLIQECVNELNRQPPVRRLFESLAHSAKVFVPYTPGKEDKLVETLLLLKKALENDAREQQLAADAKRLARRTDLEQKGLTSLRNGDFSRGKSALKVLAEEFGEEPGLLARVGEWMLEYRLCFEAAEILEQAMELFPKDSKAYRLASEAYAGLHEQEKLESVYLRAIREFGRHPRTLLHLARLYQNWNRREEAFHLAKEAWAKDNSLAEAKEIVDKNASLIV